MACCEPAVIPVSYGESIDLQFTYLDENGVPLNLSSAVPHIYSSSPAAIKEDATFTVVDAVHGKARFFLGRDAAAALRRGRNNRFRLQMIFGPESDDITPDIYLQVT